MAFRFDERAMAIIRGEVHAYLTGWGSYPLFLSAIYKFIELLGLINYRIEIIYWFNQSLGLITALIVMHMLKHFQVSERVITFVLVPLFLWNPLQIYINSMNISESLFQTTAIMALAMYLKCFRMGEWVRWGGFFALLAVAVLVRNIILPFVLLLPVYLFFFDRDGFQALKTKPFWVGAAMGIAILFMSGKMNARFDISANEALNSNRGANIAQTWCEATVIDFKTADRSFWFSPPDYWSMQKTKSLYLSRDFSETSYYGHLGLKCLQKDPSLAVLRLRSLLNVFDGPLYPDPLKNKLSPSKEIYDVGYLFVFLFVFFSLPELLKIRSARFLMFYIVGCFAAVYAANIGEARFLYSFLPMLVVLVALSWIHLRRCKAVALLLVSGAVTVAVHFIPSLPALMESRDRNQYLSLSVDERRALISAKLKHLPKTKTVVKSICEKTNQTYFSSAVRCLRYKAPCSEVESRNILREFKLHVDTAWTEEQLFCRNFTMLQLIQDKGLKIPFSLIQKPSPLPDGVNSIVHPIVAVAGQLLHVELLRASGYETDLPEPYDLLLFTLLKFQHRYDYNRPEYAGAVTENLKSGIVSESAIAIFGETLQGVLRASW